MSKITTIIDAMILRLEEVLPDYKRLPNPHEISENYSLFLKQGFGVKVGPGSQVRRLLACQLPIARTFEITLTQEFFALENDSERKSLFEEKLLEAHVLILKDFEKNTTLNETAIVTKYESDSGIQFVFQDKERFLSISTLFTVEYFEDLND